MDQLEITQQKLQEYLQEIIQKEKTKGFVIGVENTVGNLIVPHLCIKCGYPTILVNITDKENKKNELITAYMNWAKTEFSNIEYHNIDIRYMLHKFENELWPLIFDYNKYSDLENSQLVSTTILQDYRLMVLKAFENASGFFVIGDAWNFEFKFKADNAKEMALIVGIPKEVLDVIN